MSKLFLLCFLFTGYSFLTSFSFSPSADFKSLQLVDSLELDRKKYMDQVLLTIKGKEKMAVDSVFTNLKVLSGFPAENLVFAMNAWGKALGVSCGHCHNTSDFALDEIDKKEIAREMVSLGTLISDKLKTIKGLSARPIVNCTTCHRGTLKPEFRFPAK